MIFSEHDLFFLDYLKDPRVSKVKHTWFWEERTRSSPEIIEMRSFGFSHKRIEKLLDQDEAT